MKKLTFLISAIAFILLFSCTQSGLDYPETRMSDKTDDYFGTEVADPYRWLEDDNSEETTEWVKAQNLVTFSYLERIPFREKVKERLTEVWNYPRVSAPWKDGGYYFFTKNDGLQNQSVYYMQKDLESEPELFLDPNELSEDGTVALTNFELSKDGKYFGYGISRGGSDWRELYVRDMATGEDMDDHIMWAKFSGISWYKNGFFYSSYPEPKEGDVLKGENKNNKVYYHLVGTNQEEDKLIYEDPDHPEWGFYVSVTEDQKYLVLSTNESTSGNALAFKESKNESKEFTKIVSNFDNNFWALDHVNGSLLVITDYQASNYKLIAIDVNNPAEENWKDVITERPDMVLQNVTIGGDKLIASYLKDAHSRIEIFNINGEFLYELELPALGSLRGFSAKKDENTAFYTFTSFTYPPVVYKYDIQNNKSELYYTTELDFVSEDYVTKQVFYESKDGTKIPMFIVYKKDIELDGNNPTLLYGYGGFNISRTPGFNTAHVIWLENGGVYALANIRGGGEYGEKWHQAGTKMNKQNVFDDFIFAAKYLINENYTNPGKLAIQGGSNGGLLVGAVINQAPELFRVALPAVGVMDMLRYHKFTIGRYWATDYGTSEDNEEMFKYLYAYSPLHSIKEGAEYPAVMATTADHDDRVVPAHSFKYISTLQERYNGKNPVLIRIETKAGHGGGKPTSKRIEEAADLWSFTFYNMGITPAY
ncbi:Prolyl endopeptidase [subsurface metagenome]